MRFSIINNRATNVTLIFLISYTLVHLLYLFYSYFCAIFIEVPDVTFYFAYIDYDVTGYTGWSRLRVIILFGIPTFLMLVTAFLFWLAMKKSSIKDSSKLKLFLLWSMLSSLSFVIADFISAPFYRHGVSVVAEWFYFKKETVFIASLLFWALIPFIGWYFSKPLMRVAYSRRFLRSKWSRISFLANTILLPFLLVSVILAILLIISPGYSYEFYLSIDFVRVFVLIGILSFVFLFNFHKRYLAIRRNRELENLNFTFIFVSIFSFSVIYLVLYII